MVSAEKLSDQGVLYVPYSPFTQNSLQLDSSAEATKPQDWLQVAASFV